MKKTSTLTDRLKKATMSPQPQGRSKPLKPIEEYSESHRRHLKRAQAQSCEASLQWLEIEGVISVSVQAKNLETGMVETIPLQQSDSMSNL